MRKKLLAVLLVGVMAFSTLTACGGGEASSVSSEAPASKPAEESKPVEESKTEEEVSDMMSDETFAALQEAYGAMVETYDAVCELYSSEEIAANAEIEELLTAVKEVMDEMGELSQDQMSEEDAEVLAQAMLDLLESMELLVDGMEVVEGGDFTLMDLTSDMIDAAIYVGDEESELVLSLFTAPDGTAFCSMLEYAAATQSGDVACGAYAAETATDDAGIAWTYLTFEDVYTGTVFEMGFGESDAGECYLLLPSGDSYPAKYLSQEEAVTYMGTALALLEQAEQ